ncbi:DUF1447 family protein [Atopobacter sp. AH10]|uniref:DNA-directed RNA polymerase subunit epsilon n=1 Tax=Atopobacter sp. AH10 TaxID=2315861 RepID=UPI000EF1ED57|nr:DNA-directed RNA polymerase subunit epsilon [Atopobacter sp. AH10]RLK63991.1 DUF1447 family protein [Atopobacter sp. AH10]
MIYKVLYQTTTTQVPQRETTESLYIEANSVREVRELLDQHTSYLVEYIQELDEKHLAYEKNQPGFALTEFSNEG